jgi:hypothetical protein
MPVMEIEIELSDPLKHLFDMLPPIDQLPHVQTLTAAKHALINDVQHELANLPHMHRDLNDILTTIGQPVVAKLRQIKPNIKEQFDDKLSWKTYFMVGMISFCLNIIFNATLAWISHRFSHVHKRFPFRATIDGTHIKTKPICAVSPADYAFLRAHPTHPLLRKSLVVPYESPNEDKDTTELTQQPHIQHSQYNDLLREVHRIHDATLEPLGSVSL